MTQSNVDVHPYAAYLNTYDKTARLACLARIKTEGATLPISLAADLLCLELGADEKLAILDATGNADRVPADIVANLALEHFLTATLPAWPQDLAAAAIRLWCKSTQHALWFRVLEICRLPHVPQRVLYTVLDHAFHTGGIRVVKAAAETDGLESMSPAFHGLLLHRATQWGLALPRLKELAHAVIGDLRRQIYSDHKAIPSAIAYLARFQPDDLQTLARGTGIAEPWRDYLRLVTNVPTDGDGPRATAKSSTKKAQAKGAQHPSTAWPALWARHKLTPTAVAQALEASVAGHAEFADPEVFGGIDDATLKQALTRVNEASFTAALQRVYGYFAVPSEPELAHLVKERLNAADDPQRFVAALPLRLRVDLDLAQDGGLAPKLAQVKQEAQLSVAGKPAKHHDFSADGAFEDAEAMAARRAFFDTAYRGQKAAAANLAGGRSFWALLADAWREPAENKLNALAQAARQQNGIFRLCYLDTLGRFKGLDQAVLKTLDFIRSKEEDDVRAVIHALGGIGTPRAAQELVASLTRPNLTPALRLEACGVLARQDLTNLQGELRSALQDLTNLSVNAGVTDISTWEVRDAIASLITPTSSQSAPPEITANPGLSDQHLDDMLSGKIPRFQELSSEVKRALRTSQFFHTQVSSNSAPETIDLSPVIDMQYKALELLFREAFEEACSRLIHRGTLQRRLDVIGYARPIPQAMDEFESYIASLPVIREIPFFSKFKLRKMLRAICQFRPGRRFTLDGLKAFALFFLCFGRQECRYGLQGLFPLGFTDDKELHTFCKALHILQDFRNRAAHEGFHPDAASDIDSIWRQTSDIVETMFKVKSFIDEQSMQEYAPQNKSLPIIEKKVS